MVVNSAILHLKIRDDCLTPASQTPVLGWWGDASRHPPWIRHWSAHATARNFDEVSFKEHGVSVLPSSKIISSLCVCTTGFDTARSMFMIASINGTFTVLSPTKCLQKGDL